MMELIRSELIALDRPISIKELRKECPILADYRSISACLTEAMKYGDPKVIRERYGNGPWLYSIL